MQISNGRSPTSKLLSGLKLRKALAAILFLPQRILGVLFAYDIFISYAHKDGIAYAKALDKILRQSFTTHLDTRDFLAGQNLSLLTRLRVRQSRMLVVVARSHALGSSYWVRQEVDEFVAAGRMPILVDVDHAVETAVQTPTSERLSGWLADSVQIRANGQVIDPFLRIVDDAPDTQARRTPAPHVAQDIAARFSGDRVETRRLRIISATIVLLVAITVVAITAAFQSAASARRASAEALANDALVASTGTNLADGFLLDAADRLVRAHELVATSNVLGVSARIESLIPRALVYSSRPFQELGALVSSENIVYAQEGNSIHALRPDDLSIVQSWEGLDIGIVGIGNLIAAPGGVVALAPRRAVHISAQGTLTMNIGGPAAAPRPGGGFAPLNSTTKEIMLVDETGASSPLPCRKPEMAVAWHGFLDRDRLALAGRADGAYVLTVLDLNSCESLFTPLSNQPLLGAIVPEPKRIVLISSQSAMIFGFDLVHAEAVFVSNPSTVVAIRGSAPGFAIGTFDGGIKLFSFLANGTMAMVDQIDKVIPGTVTSISHDLTSNRLTVAGQRGFFAGAPQQTFIGATHRGVLLSIPLEVEQTKGTVITRPSPAKVLDTFTSDERMRGSHALPDNIVFVQENGALRLIRGGEVNTIEWVRDPELEDFSVTDVSAFGDTYYISFSGEDAGVIVGIAADGTELLRAPAPGGNLKLAAHRHGVLVVPEPPPGYFNFESEPIVQDYRLDGQVVKLEVPSLTFSQGNRTMMVDPTGRTAIFARFDGFEFRPLDRVSSPESCLVNPDPENPGAGGVAAAFSPEGDRAVLGTRDGILTVWQRDGNCWSFTARLETTMGRIIPTLAFDGQIVLGRSRSNPPMLRRWDAATGAEIGAGYPLDARAMYSYHPDNGLSAWVERLPIFDRSESAEMIVDYITETHIGQLDLTGDAIVERLCKILNPALTSGLVEVLDPPHPCEKRVAP